MTQKHQKNHTLSTKKTTYWLGGFFALILTMFIWQASLHLKADVVEGAELDLPQPVLEEEVVLEEGGGEEVIEEIPEEPIPEELIEEELIEEEVPTPEEGSEIESEEEVLNQEIESGESIETPDVTEEEMATDESEVSDSSSQELSDEVVDPVDEEGLSKEGDDQEGDLEPEVIDDQGVAALEDELQAGEEEGGQEKKEKKDKEKDKEEEVISQVEILEEMGGELIETDFDIDDKKKLKRGTLVSEQLLETSTLAEGRFKLAEFDFLDKVAGEALTFDEVQEELFSLSTTQEDLEEAILRSILKNRSDWIADAMLDDRKTFVAIKDKVDKGLFESLRARIEGTLASGEFSDQLAKQLEDDQEIERYISRLINSEKPKEVIKKVVEKEKNESKGWFAEDAISEVIDGDLDEFNLKTILTDRLTNDEAIQSLFLEAIDMDQQVPKASIEAPLIAVQVSGPGGSIILDPEAIEYEAGSIVMVLDLPRKFKPGIYSAAVEITNPISGAKELVMQDFAWGVLALNADKDTYKKGEIGDMHIGVLDDEGRPVCDAILDLQIIPPKGKVPQVEVTNTGFCNTFDVSNIEPDYEAVHRFSHEGDYILNLTASFGDGLVRTISKTIGVEKNPSLSIQREAATRLYPVGLAPMSLHLTFDSDFAGSITEVVPDNFQISDWVVDPDNHISPLVQSGVQADTKTITWSISASAGETKSLYYLYDAPDISPEFYLMGPLEIRDAATSGQVSYEQRSWQIANDEPSIGPDNTDELLGHWEFNTGSGSTAIDSSTYGNDGTLTNMESGDWTTSGPSSTNGNPYALDFDGSNEYITLSDPAGGELDFGDTDDFTITGWFNRDTFTTDDTIIAKRNGIAASDTGYIIYIDDSTDRLTVEVSDGSDEYFFDARTELTSSGWYHFAVIWDQDSAANTKIYIDGAVSEGSVSGTIGNVGGLANSLSLNTASESDAGNPLDGKLDDIRIYNRVLSSNEIDVLYEGNNPGGISTHLVLWLKAEEGLTTSGTDVTDWLDQSGNEYEFSQGTTANQPDLTTSAINGHSVITFDGSNDALTTTGFLEEPFSVFSVIENTDTGSNERTFFGMESDAAGSDDALYLKANNGSGNSEVSYLIGGTLTNVTTTSLDNLAYLHAGFLSGFTGGTVGFEVNGDGIGTSAGTGSFANATESAVGAGFVSDALSGYFQGDVAEILVYTTEKTGTDRQKIESYLALKYGLTLDQSATAGGTNYINSSSGTIWSVDFSDAYENDIAGLGQDDTSSLFQADSKSENSDSILRMSEQTDQEDLEFLTWSNNDGAATWTSTGAPTDYKILSRQWQAQESGDIGTVDVEFDVANSNFNVPSLQGGTSYYLIYDSDDDGVLSDETPVAMKDDGTGGDDTSSDSNWTAQINFPASMADGRIDFNIATEVDPPPTVTDANISINSGTGTGSTFIVGDQIIVTWDNSATGDNNSGLVGVTANLTGWGGGEFSTMTDTTTCGGTSSDEIYEACYTLISGAIDQINVNTSVNASNLGGQTAAADTSNASVDNEPPTVTTGAISVTGATGSSGEFIIGDTATGRWDDSVTGDNNSDTMSAASFDLSDFRSTDTAVAGAEASSIWTGSVTGAIDTQSSSNNNVTVTVTDDAGNTTTLAGTNNATVDTIAPSISSITSVAGDTTAVYYDATDDSDTEVIFVSTDTGSGVSACKWNATDVSYATMANTCAATNSCTSSLSGNGTKTIYIRCIDSAGNAMSTSTQVDYTVDSVAPSGTSITPSSTRIIDTAAPSFVVSDGTDATSGIDTGSRVLERQEATYSSNSCGTFGAYAGTAYSGTYPNISDTSVTGSKCYRYRWSASDNAGNTTTSSETAIIVRVPLTTLTITAGNNQSYGATANPIGYTLPTGLQVQASDGGTNTALTGEVTVDYAITSTPTSPTATGQSLSSASDSTDASGLTEVTFTLGDRAGDYQIEASSGDAAVSNTVTFTETADDYFNLVVIETSMLIALDPISNTTDSVSPTASITTNAASYELDLTPDQWPTSGIYEILNWASSLGFGWNLNAGTVTAFLENVGDPDSTTVYSCSGDTCQGASVIDIDLHAGIDFTQPAGTYLNNIQFKGENISY